METLWILVLLGYAVCVIESVVALTMKRPVMQRSAVAALGIAFGAHTAWLVIKGVQVGRVPLVGPEEMSVFLSWSLLVFYIAASRWYRATALRAFVFPIVLALATIALVSPDKQQAQITSNEPLDGILLPIHAGLILMAYAAFFITFAAGLMYMVQERELKQKRLGTVFHRLPSLETCDEIGTKSMAIGFVLLTLGILAGFWFTRARYGVYWQGGPLEIFSVATWVIYLFLIQTRIAAGWGGRTGALASIVSFLIVVCSLVGVGYIGHA